MTRVALLGRDGAVLATTPAGPDGTATFTVPAHTTVTGYELRDDAGNGLYVSDRITERYTRAGSYTVKVPDMAALIQRRQLWGTEPPTVRGGAQYPGSIRATAPAEPGGLFTAERVCTCITAGPDMDGPDELCPEHGRTPDDWSELVGALQERLSDAQRELVSAREALRVAVSPADAPRWRVGRTYPEHVYAGDTPVATFVGDRDTAAANARTAVLSHNRQIPGIPDGEWVVIPPMGWANRVDELLNRYGIDMRTPMDPSHPDDGPRLGAALVELIREWGVQG